MNPQPERIQVRTSAAERRILTAHPIRRPRDAGRLRVFLQSEAYCALLLVEAASEKARDPPRANDDTAAAAIGRDLALRAVTISRAIDRLKALPWLNDGRPVGGIVARRVISDSSNVPNDDGLFPSATLSQTYRHVSTER
jgi:hypothetical protein